MTSSNRNLKMFIVNGLCALIASITFLSCSASDEPTDSEPEEIIIVEEEPDTVQGRLNIKVKNVSSIDSYKVHSIDGRLIMEEKVKVSILHI